MTAETVELVLNPYDYEFHEDPYPYYKRLRDEAPLYRNDTLNFWALTRHADVHSGFRNSTAFSNKLGVSLDPISRNTEAHRTMSFLAMDDPAHLRLRTLVSKGFTPRRIRELEPRVQSLTRMRLDDALRNSDSGHFDFIADFAGKLPMDVISELVGVPEPDREQLRALADGVMHRQDGVPDVPESALLAAMDLLVYYADMVAQRRKHPTDDLTSALLEADIDGDRLADEEIMAFLFLMVVAGNETTTKLLGNAMYWGARNPDQLAGVYDDPSTVPLWVEETLRYDNSTQILARTVSGDVEFHGVTLRDGDTLLLVPGSANRDERVFDAPDEFRIGRDIGSKLLSFGSGVHFCLGAHLARMEARLALTELLGRISGYEVDEAHAVRVHSSNVRGFAALPITVRPRAGEESSRD